MFRGGAGRLLETVSVFLDSGSLVETSELLRCHRNTIVNRLTAFEKYTGLNLQKPRDAAAALLALSQLRSSRAVAPPKQN
ncbi:helix-turn-helix domain-containing protein [Arthrobacter sp. SA17]